MNAITKALLNDLQDELNKVKSSKSNIEAVWQLDKLTKSIEVTNKLILKSI